MPAQPSDPHIDINGPYTPHYPKPTVSISLNNPLGTTLKKIKNFLTHKQTLFSTSFTIKVTPIVAIVSLAGLLTVFGGGITTAYNFGKTVEQKFIATTPTPTPKVIIQTPVAVILSKAGTIKATYQAPSVKGIETNTKTDQNTNNNTIVTEVPATPTLLPTLVQTPIPTPVIIHYVLVDKNEAITFLTAPANIKLQNYLNLHVLITGSFNSTTNTLTISKSSDIEVLE